MNLHCHLRGPVAPSRDSRNIHAAQATLGCRVFKGSGLARFRVFGSKHSVAARKTPHATKKHVCSAGSYDSSYPVSYPFHENQYHRVTLVQPPYGPMKMYEDSARAGSFNGVLVFKREDDAAPSDDLTVLEVFVAGDTAFTTWSHLTHNSTDRPMAHELMWRALDRVREVEGQHWSLLRVAIVELRDNVFIGRLFFGDPDTGAVMWDCDCRPSDGCFLSIKSKCPIYVHRRVWDVAAQPIQKSSVYKLVAASMFQSGSPPPSPPHSQAGNGQAEGASHMPPSPFSASRSPSPSPASRSESGAAVQQEDFLIIRADDPPAIKLLKRELEVAIGEEDYAQCVRLRDHGWMTMYRQLHDLRVQGRFDEALKLDRELRRQINLVEDMS